MNNQQRADAILEAAQAFGRLPLTTHNKEKFRNLVLQYLCEAWADGANAPHSDESAGR